MEKIYAAVQLLHEAGLEDEAEALLDEGRFKLNSHKDIDMILALMNGLGVAKWMFFRDVPSGCALPLHGYKFQPSGVAPVTCNVQQISSEMCVASGYLVEFELGQVEYFSTISKAVEQYIKRFITVHMGNYSRAISQFRQACKDALQVEKSAKLTISGFRRVSWRRKNVQQMADFVGRPLGDDEFVCTVGELISSACLHILSYFEGENLKWEQEKDELAQESLKLAA